MWSPIRGVTQPPVPRPERHPVCASSRSDSAHVATAKGGGNGRGDRADGAGAGIGLPVDGCHPPDGDRPGDEIAVQCRGCLRYSPCPGLSNCRARLVLADGGNTAAALLPGTGGSSVHQLSGATLPLAAHSKRPASTKQVPPPLLFGQARPSTGEAEGRGPCSRRLDEIETELRRMSPRVGSLPPGPNQSEPCGFVRTAPVFVLAPAPAAAGRGGRGNRRDSSECFAPSVHARGPNLLAEVLFTVYSILRAKPGIPARRFRQT